jgi:acetoacetate decarboxylase
VHESDTIVGTLHYGSVLCVTMTLGYKHKILPTAPIAAALAQANFLLKIIPHVDATPRVCELVRYHMTNFVVKGAWSSPAALELHPHALADVARLPVREIVSGAHYVADLTLGLGEVAFDYLAGRGKA